MKVYVVTANYFTASADTLVDADVIIDSVWADYEDAMYRVEEINEKGYHEEGIVGKKYYGEVTEKELNTGDYYTVAVKPFPLFNSPIRENTLENTLKMVNIDFSKIEIENEESK